MSDRDYAFPGLPLEPVRAGRTILVRGSNVDGAKRVILRATAPDGIDEGTVLVSTNTTGDALLDDRREWGCAGDDRVCVIDCVSLQQGTEPSADRIKGVSTPADLTGVGMQASAFYQLLYDQGVDRIRVGLLSASTLLMYSDLRRVSRFVHTLTGRVAATDGLALVALDDDSHDEQVVSTFEQMCDGRIDLRIDGDRREIRVLGLPGQPEGWLPLD